MVKNNYIAKITIVLLLVTLAVTNSTALSTPYSLSGHIYDSDGTTPIVGASISFTNQNSSEVIYATSTTNGEYQQDAANFPSGYYDNDTIQYQTTYFTQSNTTTANITVSGGGTLLNIVLSAATGGASNITAEIGSRYIKWSWISSGTVAVYIDGKFVTNTTLNYYILSDLNPREAHTIALCSPSGAVYDTSSDRTFYPEILFYIIFLLAGMLLFAEIITAFMVQKIIAIVLGTMAFIMGIFGFYMSYPYHFSIMAYLCIIIAVIALIWIILVIFSLLIPDNEDFGLDL